MLKDIDLKELIERETGEKFNREGFIKCPFHIEKTPSMSVKFYPDKNKYKYKCFGCGENGDAIDFIMKYKILDYPKAREFLGIPLEKTVNEKLEDKIKNFIEWELKNYREGQELLGIFTFVNKNNEPIYYKAKFFDKNTGKKTLGYYSFESEKVKPKRNSDEVPYNLYNVIKAIESGKRIIIVEGEKDANTLNSLFRNGNFIATSLKGVKDLSYLQGAKIAICSDSGEAGEKYAEHFKNELFLDVQELRIIKLPGLKALGDNKDVTDWLEAGHTKNEFENAFNRSLDLKSKFELQQNSNGVYKWIWNKKTEEYYKSYITNFKILEAKRIKYFDDEVEGIKLILKSNTDEVFERYGYSTVFDDMKSFKNFLGTLDLAFIGDVKALTEFKIWVNKYFALENEEIHSGAKFLEKDGEIIFITKEGAVTNKGLNANIKADSNIASSINQIEKISKEEFKQLRKNFLKFATPEKTISIVGTLVNNLAVYHAKALGVKLHHLLIVGESGSGKSTILENVIGAILNIDKTDIKSIGLTSAFGFIKSLSEGNYPLLLEEFKPSSLDRYKIQKISEILRNAYDGTSVSKGNRSLKTVEFKLDRPLILVGEESYPNEEKALIERSCIVYLSRNERTEAHTKAMEWIKENQHILRKLGRTIIDIILSLSIEEYQEMRKKAVEKIEGLVNRPLNTAINIHCGIQILNKVAVALGEREFQGFEEYIINNIKNEVLEGAEEVKSTVEKMLITFNQMLDDSRVAYPETVFLEKNGRVYIKTSEMINLIYEHTQRFGTDIVPLKLKDFKKQAQKAAYIIESNIPMKMKQPNGLQKTVRMDEYDIDKLRDLQLYQIVEPIFEVPIEPVEGESIPF